VPVRGDLLKSYLLAAFTFRFMNEWLRAEDPDAFGLTGPQLVLVPVLAALIVHFARSWRRGAWNVPAPRPYRHADPSLVDPAGPPRGPGAKSLPSAEEMAT